MNNHKKYKNPNSIDCEWAKLLYLFVFPLIIISLVSYLSLLFMGLTFTCVFYSIATVFINFYIHGIKKISRSKREFKPAIIAVPSVVVLLMLACTYLILLAIIAFVSIGAYQLVLYKKTNDFNNVLFIIWSFCVIGSPVLYYLFLFGNHSFLKWKMASNNLTADQNIDHNQDTKIKQNVETNFQEKNSTQQIQILYKEAWAFIGKKKYDLAQEKCEAIIAICPSYGYAYFLKLRLLWYIEGFDACYENKEYYIEKTKHESGALAHIYNNYGCLLDAELRYEEAKQYFEKAVQTCPKEGMYISNLAETHYKLKNHNEAFRFANEAVEKEYTSPITKEIITNNGKINEIDFLHLELAQLANVYRSEVKNSKKEKLILEHYYNRFNRMVELNNGYIGLDPDAELPDDLMPKEYVDFWLKNN